MDDRGFDRVARAMASGTSRRGALAGVLGLGLGLAINRSTMAACPPGRVSIRGECRCQATGRPPVGGVCPCPAGQTDSGDGLGCLECRVDADCPGSLCFPPTCAAGTCSTPDPCVGSSCLASTEGEAYCTNGMEIWHPYIRCDDSSDCPDRQFCLAESRTDFSFPRKGICLGVRGSWTHPS